MDMLTFRTGIDRCGRRVPMNGIPPRAPTAPERHANRLTRALATVEPPPTPARVRVRREPDGRYSYPGVVGYRIFRWNPAVLAYEPAETLPVPPTVESHPDPDALVAFAVLGKMYGGRPMTLPYKVEVFDLPAYERLSAAGMLTVGHATPPPADAS